MIGNLFAEAKGEGGRTYHTHGMLMKKLMFGFLFLTLAAAGKDREYKAAILVSQGSVSTGTHCSSGGLAIPVGIGAVGSGSASCAEAFRRIYHVRVEGGYDYVLAGLLAVSPSNHPFAAIGQVVKFAVDS